MNDTKYMSFKFVGHNRVGVPLSSPEDGIQIQLPKRFVSQLNLSGKRLIVVGLVVMLQRRRSRF